MTITGKTVRQEILSALADEKKCLAGMGVSSTLERQGLAIRSNCEGWIEALSYVLLLIDEEKVPQEGDE
tara:strand:- start:366 stop:572 length:207 start_codon:yes stop_codon:yes gene_type:complete